MDADNVTNFFTNILQVGLDCMFLEWLDFWLISFKTSHIRTPPLPYNHQRVFFVNTNEALIWSHS